MTQPNTIFFYFIIIIIIGVYIPLLPELTEIEMLNPYKPNDAYAWNPTPTEEQMGSPQEYL